jgi:hypothetical protein
MMSMAGEASTKDAVIIMTNPAEKILVITNPDRIQTSAPNLQQQGR